MDLIFETRKSQVSFMSIYRQPKYPPDTDHLLTCNWKLFDFSSGFQIYCIQIIGHHQLGPLIDIQKLLAQNNLKKSTKSTTKQKTITINKTKQIKTNQNKGWTQVKNRTKILNSLSLVWSRFFRQSVRCTYKNVSLGQAGELARADSVAYPATVFDSTSGRCFWLGQYK